MTPDLWFVALLELARQLDQALRAAFEAIGP